MEELIENHHKGQEEKPEAGSQEQVADSTDLWINSGSWILMYALQLKSVQSRIDFCIMYGSSVIQIRCFEVKNRKTCHFIEL